MTSINRVKVVKFSYILDRSACNFVLCYWVGTSISLL